MSRTDFTRFMSRLNTDESLRKGLQARVGDRTHQIPAEELIKFAGENGYRFSVTDATEELSDDELEEVAGGVTSLQYHQKLIFSPIQTTFQFIVLGDDGL